ncbi:glycerol-3-phosphate dehydrogenase/oxidase [Bacillus massiliglaciei]|uniref:glycerol-3-phosphate dehydrogenase/oxidase n=1 Tax=Bacillus massiliglaciei TaxID=1816693 RepID=UPI000B277B21|nr:FAD-dependent oxidoreductase [Bacillus massiliglaciei]
MAFTNLKRTEIKEKLKKQEYDLLVIGGGITGSGISLDATTRGMKTALVEMQDFAAGTSSRSTKLVHGGLRYLKQFEVGMVAEVGKERAIVYENGPHVTTPEWMLLPFHEGGTFGKFTTSIGLRVYDFLAGVKRAERRSILTREETSRKEPLVKKEGLLGGGYYVEYRTDDARLTIEVAKKASELGADLLNYTKVVDFTYENGKVNGAVVEDVLTKEKYEIKAKKVINAAGPWVDSLREKDDSKKGKTLHLTKGVHVVIDQSKFPLTQAVYFDTPDGRMIFAIPRAGKAYVGTTDTFYEEDPINPKMTEADRDYIVEAIHYMFPEAGITADDIESSWAGVRPLIHEEGKDPSEISRKDEIWVSNTGLVTIAGGKLTGYRKMAEQVVDKVAGLFKEEEGILFDKVQTKHLPISGGDIGGSGQFESFVQSTASEGVSAGLTREQAEGIARMYGTNAKKVFNLVKGKEAEAKKYGLPLDLYGKAAYAVQYEMAATPLDVLMRRTGAILFDIKTAKSFKEGIVKYMQDVFGWSEKEASAYKEEVDRLIHQAETPVKS